MTPGLARALPSPWSLLVAGLLVAAFLLGVAAGRGTLDPNLHAMTGVVAVGLAALSHVRRGGGLDFLAALLLAATVGLGTMTQAESVGRTLHLAVALPATLLSVGLHLAGRTAPGRGAGPGVATLKGRRE